MLEKLENESFLELGWKAWKTGGFSPALVGKAGIFGPNIGQHIFSV